MESLCTNIRCFLHDLGFLVVFLLVTSLTHLHALNNCSNLVTRDANAESVFLPCTEYETDACKNGARPGGFPANFSKAPSAPLPRSLQVTQFVGQIFVDGKQTLATGLNVSWTEPELGDDRSILKGYYLKIEKAGSAAVVDCRLFDLQNSNATDTTGPLKFSYTILSRDFNGMHSVKMCSLPLTFIDELQRKCLSELITFTTPDPHFTFSTSTMAYTPSRVPSPAPTKNDTGLVQSSTMAATPTSNTQEKDTGPVQSSTAAVTTTSTTRDNNNNTATEMSPTAYYSTDEKGSSATDVGVVVAVALGSVVLVVGVLVVGCLWKHRRSVLQACRKLEHKEDGAVTPCPENASRDLFPATPYHLNPLAVPDVRRKSVLLLASEDHKYFSQALHSFAAFLRLHCQCDVMFAPQQLSDVRETANSYVWLSGKIDQADVVIIVTSEAACRLYRAFQNGQLYKEADLGLEGDLFTPGIQHICGKIANGEDVSKVMMVRFSHTAITHCLPVSALPPSFYPLPARLRSFLLHLHSLDDNTMDLSRVNLPLGGNEEELEGGKEWLGAVQDSILFEQEHPQWFEETFGKPVSRHNTGRPVYTSTVHAHNTEEFTSLQRRLSSVSTHAKKNYLQPSPQDVVEDPGVAHTESEFIPPSVFDANSAHTVPFSVFTASERPAEIDEGLSHQFRMVNEQCEHDLRQKLREQWEGSVSPHEQDSLSAEDPSSISDLLSAVPDCNMVKIQLYYENYDCISVSSAQSV